MEKSDDEDTNNTNNTLPHNDNDEDEGEFRYILISKKIIILISPLFIACELLHPFCFIIPNLILHASIL